MTCKQFFARLAVTSGAVVLLSTSLGAQEVPRFSFDIGGGFYSHGRQHGPAFG